MYFGIWDSVSEIVKFNVVSRVDSSVTFYFYSFVRAPEKEEL